MSQSKEKLASEPEGGAASAMPPAELLRSLVDAPDLLVYAKDRDGRYLFVNRAAAASLGRAPEEITGLDDAQLLSAEVARELRRHDEAVMAAAVSEVVEEKRLIRGAPSVFLSLRSPLWGPGGEVLGVIGLSSELTDRDRAYGGLLQTEARLRRLVDSNIIGLVFGRDGGVITDANDAFLGMLGYTREDLRTGRLTRDLIVVPEFRKLDVEAARQLARAGACAPYEKEYLHKNGTRIPVLVGIVANPPAPGDWVAFVLNLSERKRAEEESRQLTRQLERQLAEFETLLSVVPIGVAVARDPECRYIVANPYFARLLKVPLGENASLSAPAEERPTRYRVFRDGREVSPEELPLQRAAAEGREVIGWEAEVRVEGEQPRTMLSQAAPLFDESGRPRGAIGAFLDISERTRAEAARELLAHAGKVLAGTLDYERTLQSVAALAVPRFADWCFVDLVQDNGSMRRVANAYANPARTDLARTLSRFTPKGGALNPSDRARESGAAVLLDSSFEELFSALANDEAHVRALRELAPVSVIVAPLLARGRGLGAVTFISAESGRRYGPSDVTLAEELARRAAVAVDNARLYRAAQESARRAEESLALLDTLLASAPVGFALLDLGLRYVRVNDAFAATIGMKATQIEGRTPREILPDLADPLEARYRYVLERGEPIVSREVSGEIPLAPGDPRSWISSYYPVRTRDGELIGIGAIVTDITERKRAEENERFLSQATALLASSLDYEATFEQLARLMVPRLGDWCTVTLLEGSALRLMGAAHRDPSKLERLHELDRKYLRRVERSPGLEQLVATGRPVFTPELSAEQLAAVAESPEHLALMREVGMGGVLAVPLSLRGRLVGVLGTGRSEPGRLRETDLALLQELARRAAVTMENARLHREAERARAAAEAAAHRSAFLAEAGELLASSLELDEILQSMVRLAVPALADAIAVLLAEDDGTLKEMAQAALDARVAAVAQRLRDLPARARAEHPMQEVFSRGEVRHIPDYVAYATAQVTGEPEYEALLREVGPCDTVMAPLVARGRTLGVLALSRLGHERRYAPEDVGLITDLARRLAQAMENNRLYRDAQLAVRLRDDFLSIASHELRTPLAALQLQVTGMLRAAAKGEATLASSWVASRTAKAAANLERLAGLVDKLLDVSRLTSGQLELALEPVDLSALAREVAEHFAEQLEGASLTVRAEQAVVGHWDRFRLEQVVTNLLANAIKYGRGKPIELEVAATPGMARLRVTDHGIGISSEGLARLFGRFERAVSPRQYGGFGLGLWIAKQIVEALGGRIAVESQPEQGSTFTVELPTAGAHAR